MFFLYFTQFCDMLPVLRRCIPFGQLLTVIFPVCPEIISTCAVAIQWLVCMQAIAMQTQVRANASFANAEVTISHRTWPVPYSRCS